MKDNNPVSFLDHTHGIIVPSIADIIVYPAWYLSIKKIIRPQDSVGTIINNVMEKDGFGGLYTGLAIGVASRALTCLVESNAQKLIESLIQEPSIDEPEGESSVVLHRAMVCLFSSVIATTVTTPLETIQNNMISNPHLPLSSIWDNLVNDFGPSVLFKGLLPNVIGVAIRRMVNLFGLPFLKQLFASKEVVSKGDPKETMAEKKCVSPFAFIASNLLSSFLSAPFYFAVVYLQAFRNFKSMPECWSSMSNTHGMSILWTSFPLNFITLVARKVLICLINHKMGFSHCDGDGYTRPC